MPRSTNFRRQNALRCSALHSSALCLSLAITLQAVPALAQDADPSAPAPAPVNAPAPAPAPSSAQQTSPQTELADTGPIIVTGSRIARPNLTATVPVSTIDASELERTGNLSLADAINKLPSMAPTSTLANSTGSIGTAGLSALDLRGLGETRTLVLINGRRTVTSSPGTSIVDISTIPSHLLERVDVVTGGNSAIYGSDAVAGVVNFITRRNFEGLELSAQGGISSRGDRGSYRLAATAGRNFADGRGNAVISASYDYSDALFVTSRPKQTGAYDGTKGYFTVDSDIVCNGSNAAICDPKIVNNSDGIPDTAYFGGPIGSKFNIVSMGGTVLTSCPAATDTNAVRRGLVCAPNLSADGGRLADNYMFMPNGDLVRNNLFLDLRPLATSGSGATLGGFGATGIEGAMLQPGIERFNAYAAARYEFSPAFELFGDARFTKVIATQSSDQPQALSLSGVTSVFRIDNPYLTDQARETLRSILPDGATQFQMLRFIGDFGSRREEHERKTYAVTAGLRGQFSDAGNWRYEVSANWGRTETYYESDGYFNVDRINKALNPALLNGQIVCAVNADSDTSNDDAECRPIDVFGTNSIQRTRDGYDYAVQKNVRKQWATLFSVSGFVSGDSGAWFELPGGSIGVALGAEYRRDDAFSAYDAATEAGETTLNQLASFDPKAVTVREIFGEIRIPIVKDMPFMQELTLEASGRISDYSNVAKAAKAYNVGLIYSPFEGLRLRGNYARSVRAPSLSNTAGSRNETFATITDPCSQSVINSKPNRVRNCAAAGIPVTLTLPDGSVVPWNNRPTSGVSGFNQGNPNLEPEIGTSWTFGGVFQPSFLPGFHLSMDYYRIKVRKAIASLSGQAIIDRCYDDANGLDNIYCDAVFRRRTPDNPISDFTFDGQSDRTVAGFPSFEFDQLGPAFLNQPYNYAQLKASGINGEIGYRHSFGPDTQLNLTGKFSWIENREDFSSIEDPTFSDRLHGELGVPRWRVMATAHLVTKSFDAAVTTRWFSKQSISNWDVQHSHQGRAPTNLDSNPDVYYRPVTYVDMELGARIGNGSRAYIGVDNMFDKLPPRGALGTGSASGIFNNIGRFFYAGIRTKL